MKRWSWKRIAFAVGGVVLGAIGAAVPVLAPAAALVGKILLAAGAVGAGVAIRTPGHQPARKSDDDPTHVG